MDKFVNNDGSLTPTEPFMAESELTAARQDIEQTRVNMGETLEAIDRKSVV